MAGRRTVGGLPEPEPAVGRAYGKVNVTGKPHGPPYMSEEKTNLILTRKGLLEPCDFSNCVENITLYRMTQLTGKKTKRNTFEKVAHAHSSNFTTFELATFSK